MAFNEITPGSPFQDYFINNLPEFYKYMFNSEQTERMQQLFASFDTMFDNVYQKIKTIPDLRHPLTVEAKFIYELSQLVGITDIVDLSQNIDSTGNLINITESQFNYLLNFQRTNLLNSTDRYLMKGTITSISKLLYAHGLRSTINEKWITSGGGALLDQNDDFIKYGNSFYEPSNPDMYNEQTYDLLDEISTFVPEASGYTDVEEYIDNWYGYQYIRAPKMQDDIGDIIYYKTPEVVLHDESDVATWYTFEQLAVTGNIIEMKTVTDKLFIRTDLNNLVVYPFDLDDPNISPLFSIDNENCYSIKIIEDDAYVLLDRGTYLEVRDLSTFSPISKITKPEEALITDAIKKIANEYLIINANYNSYLIDINLGIIETFPLTAINLDANCVHTTYQIVDNEFLILKFDTMTNELSTISGIFDNSYVLTMFNVIVASSTLKNVQKFRIYNRKILVISSNKLGIYNVFDNSWTETDYRSASTHTFNFNDSEFNVEEFGAVVSPTALLSETSSLSLSTSAVEDYSFVYSKNSYIKNIPSTVSVKSKMPTGGSAVLMFHLQHNDGDPIPRSIADQVSRNIVEVYQNASGVIKIRYRDSSGNTFYCQVGTQLWDANLLHAYVGTTNTKYRVELVNDGERWKIIIYSDAEALLVQTPWINWSDSYSNMDDTCVLFGDPWNDAHYGSLIVYEYKTTDAYMDIFYTDKFYLKRIADKKIFPLKRITGWNLQVDEKYKSHYFDLLVELGTLPFSDADITSSNLGTKVAEMIEFVKPIHTALASVLINIKNIYEAGIDDSLSTADREDGGSIYKYVITGDYSGKHPYTRYTGSFDLYFNNDGLDGRPLLNFSPTEFEIGYESTDEEVLNKIIHNT